MPTTTAVAIGTVSKWPSWKIHGSAMYNENPAHAKLDNAIS